MTFLSNSALLLNFLTAEGCSAANIYQRMKSVYGDMCVSDGVVRKWVRVFKGEDPKQTTVFDRKRPGRPLSAPDTNHQEAIDSLVRANRRIKQKEIAYEVGISKERVHHIVRSILGYRKVSAQ